MNIFKKLVLSAAAIIMAASMLTGCSSGDSVNNTSHSSMYYVKNADLFSDCPDVSLEQVMNKYLENPFWTSSGSDDMINVSGVLKGIGENLSVTVKITKGSDPQSNSFSVTGAAINDSPAPTVEDAELLLSWMFQAYRDGYETFADFTAANPLDSLN